MLLQRRFLNRQDPFMWQVINFHFQVGFLGSAFVGLGFFNSYLCVHTYTQRSLSTQQWMKLISSMVNIEVATAGGVIDLVTQVLLISKLPEGVYSHHFWMHFIAFQKWGSYWSRLLPIRKYASCDSKTPTKLSFYFSTLNYIYF